MGAKPILEWLELEDDDDDDADDVEEDYDDDDVTAAAAVSMWSSSIRDKRRDVISRGDGRGGPGSERHQQQKIQAASCGRRRLRADTLQPVPPSPTSSAVDAEPCFVMLGWMVHWLNKAPGGGRGRQETGTFHRAVETLSPLGVKTLTKMNGINSSKSGDTGSMADSCCSAASSTSASSSTTSMVMIGVGADSTFTRPRNVTRGSSAQSVLDMDESNRLVVTGGEKIPDFDYREYRSLSTAGKQRSW
jgi:hypothetical protein